MAEGEQLEGKQPGGGQEGRLSPDDVLKQMAESLPEEKGTEPKGSGAYAQLRQRLSAVIPDIRQAGKRIKLPEVKVGEAASRAQENVVGFISSRAGGVREGLRGLGRKPLDKWQASDVEKFLDGVAGKPMPYPAPKPQRAGGDVLFSVGIGVAGSAARRMIAESLGTPATVGVVSAGVTLGRNLRTIFEGRSEGKTALEALGEKYTAERKGKFGKFAQIMQWVERKVAKWVTREETSDLTRGVIQFAVNEIRKIDGEEAKRNYLRDKAAEDIAAKIGQGVPPEIAQTRLIRVFGELTRARAFNGYRDLMKQIKMPATNFESIRGVLYEKIKSELLEVREKEGAGSVRFKELHDKVASYNLGIREYHWRVGAIMGTSAGMSIVRSLVGLSIGEALAEGLEHLPRPVSVDVQISPPTTEVTEVPTEAPAVAAATETPTATPSPAPTEAATAAPTSEPTAAAAAATATPEPTPTATVAATPTPEPTVAPTAAPGPTATPPVESVGGEALAHGAGQITPEEAPGAEGVTGEQPPAEPAAEEAFAPGTEDMPKGPPEAAAAEAEVQPLPEAQPEAPAEQPFFHPQEGEYPWTTGAREGAEWASGSGLPDTIAVGNWALDPEAAARNLGGWARAFEPDLTQKEGEELFGWFGKTMSWAQENPEEFRSLHIEPLSVVFNPTKLEAAMMAIEDPDMRRMVATSMISNGMIPQEHEESRKLLWEIIRGRR